MACHLPMDIAPINFLQPIPSKNNLFSSLISPQKEQIQAELRETNLKEKPSDLSTEYVAG